MRLGSPIKKQPVFLVKVLKQRFFFFWVAPYLRRCVLRLRGGAFPGRNAANRIHGGPWNLGKTRTCNDPKSVLAKKDWRKMLGFRKKVVCVLFATCVFFPLVWKLVVNLHYHVSHGFLPCSAATVFSGVQGCAHCTSQCVLHGWWPCTLWELLQEEMGKNGEPGDIPKWFRIRNKYFDVLCN